LNARIDTMNDARFFILLREPDPALPCTREHSVGAPGNRRNRCMTIGNPTHEKKNVPSGDGTFHPRGDAAWL